MSRMVPSALLLVIAAVSVSTASAQQPTGQGTTPRISQTSSSVSHRSSGAAVVPFAFGVQQGHQNGGPISWSVGPSFEDLVDKLDDLRARKKYDYEHGRKYQAYLAQKIEIVKNALRKHHGSRGEKAARNEKGDYDPPR